MHTKHSVWAATAESWRRLARVCDLLGEDAEKPRELSWLTDNRYMLAASAQEAVGFFRRTAAPRAGAVFSLCRDMVRDCQETALSREFIVEAVDRAQEREPLAEADIACVIPALQAALIQNAASLCPIFTGLIRRTVAATPALRQSVDTALRFTFDSLRYLSDSVSLSQALFARSTVHRCLMRDPAGVYPHMHERSQGYYRMRLSQLARRRGLSEAQAARDVLRLAEEAGGDPRRGHVGYYILVEPLGGAPSRAGRMLYSLALGLLPVLLTALLWPLTGAWALLSYPALLAFVKHMADAAALRWVRPTHIPRMAMEGEIPPEGATLCVIAALLTDPKQADTLAGRLEEYAVAAQPDTVGRDEEPRLRYGLLVDFKDAPEQDMPGDAGLLEAARAAVARLNDKWPGRRFYLFWRGRVFCPGEQRFLGWERKRGALVELSRLLCGEESGLRAEGGDSEALSRTRFVVTLDADTRPALGALRALIGAMLHPLNRPVVDEGRRVVTAGHALLQPRISVALDAAMRTPFARLFAGQGGLDPYGGACGDLYQDLFGEGSFNGKGIFDLRVFHGLLADRFPPQTVLSHDLLEGAFLRTGFVGEVAFQDGFPARSGSYFDRQHRWVRGDVQTLRFLGARLPAHGGRREKNPLSALSKWKILDNFRRSLTPLFLTALLLAAVGTRRWILALPVLLALGAPLLTELEAALRRLRQGPSRLLAPVLAGPAGMAVRLAMGLALLPYEVSVNCNAVARALWRMTVSHRHMLEWVTAAESERSSHSSRQNPLYAALRRMFVCFIAAAAFFAAGACAARAAGGGFTALLPGLILGFIFAAAPFACAALDRERPPKPALSEADRLWLREQTGAMLNYYTDFLSPQDNFLPPDNYQEQPAAGLARRTSPTNIGLTLLSLLAARDLDLLEGERLLYYVDGMLGSLERLEKWHGHLLNWYATADLQPLQPRWVSTVDSGNLAVCLIALEQGLLELNEPQATELATRARTLWEGMDFTPLYDRCRGLFTLGWELGRDRPSASYYDLMASEARLASYFAVARGQVPLEHWERLSRVLRSLDGYRGMASWSGTAFEYFMPRLLLPNTPGSLWDESLRFALYCQTRRPLPAGMPWGISESAAFAFDGELNYQYKAHGVQSLGLQRGLSRETVLSPYSAFLALTVDPAQALSNLRRYDRFDMRGRYGLYEAMDLTRRRIPRGADYMPVRCYMVHHLGMSLLAIHHVLTGGGMERRFLRDPAMRAYGLLLQERIPFGARAISLPHATPPNQGRQAARTTFDEGYHLEATDYDPFTPRCVSLGNAAYRVFLTDTGLSCARSTGLQLTAYDGQPLGQDTGLQFFLQGEALGAGDGILSLYPAPLYDPAVGYVTRFFGERAETLAQTPAVATCVTTMVSASDPAELRLVTVENTGGRSLRLLLHVRFAPVLCPAQDYQAHPAFSRMFLSVRSEGNCVHLTRRSREGGSGAYAAFISEEPAVYTLSREGEGRVGRVPRLTGSESLMTAAGEADSAGTDAFVHARVEILLAAGQRRSLRFALASGPSPEAAAQAARRTLTLSSTGASHRLDETMALLKLNASDVAAAFDMVADCEFFTDNRRRGAEFLTENRLGRDTLWKFGFSDDPPYVLLEASLADTTDAGALERFEERLFRLLSRHLFLFLNGCFLNCVLLLDDGGDYRRPLGSAVRDVLRALDGENMLGVRSGVHIVDASRISEEERRCLRGLSALYLDMDGAEYRASRREKRVLPPVLRPGPAEFDPKPAWGERSFSFSGLGPQVWSHVLANRSFGYLAADCGCGHMWEFNSRENKINPWYNDPLTLEGPERIRAVWGGGEASIFADADGYECRTTFGMGYARWEKRCKGLELRTTAFVHPYFPLRVMQIEVSGPQAAHLRLHYSTELILGADRSAAAGVVSFFDEKSGALAARSAANRDYAPCVFGFCSYPEPEARTCDARSAALGDYDGRTGAGLAPAIAARIPLKRTPGGWCAVLVCGCVPRRELLTRLSAFASFEKAREAYTLTRRWWDGLTESGAFTRLPDEAVGRYLDGFALYQVLSCRLFGRTSLYQNGGAYGFRDQLQDCLALIAAPPQDERLGLSRTQILRAAARQYEEGDVQHWWHPRRGGPPRGVRTRISDDLLFLPFVACRWAAAAGDGTIFDLKIPYLRSAPLAPHEKDRYEEAQVSPLRESLYDHCLRAFDCVAQRGTGENGLCRMGGGDWNDGMDTVEGESVWLSWFCALALREFAPVCLSRGDEERARRFLQRAETLADAANRAWDGDHYLRGFYADGSTLGSARDDACQIDAIAQAFSALAGGGKTRSREALLEAFRRLVDEENRLVRLFDPPFTADSAKNPGYIKHYPPGMRENGGQYTHAAVWLAWGLFAAGLEDEARHVMALIAPSNRDLAVYRTEPCYLAADVYAPPAPGGRGGWSLYTGAASWYYAVAREYLR